MEVIDPLSRVKKEAEKNEIDWRDVGTYVSFSLFDHPHDRGRELMLRVMSVV